MLPDGPLHIGIHPYTSGLLTNQDLTNYNYEDQPGYVERREARLHNPALRQILLVTEYDFRRTVWRYRLNQPQWQGRVIQTPEGTPAPIKMSFGELSSFIVETYPASGYIFWGAELYEINRTPVAGCVKYAHDSLSLPNKSIDRESCWKRPITAGMLKSALHKGDLTSWDILGALFNQRPPYLIDSSPLLPRPK